MNGTSRSIARYVEALVFTAAAVLIRWLLDPWLGEHQPFSPLYGAVVLSVWRGGYRPALLAAVVGYFASNLLFVAPRWAFLLNTPVTAISFISYLASITVICAAGQAMRNARQQAEASTARLEQEAASRQRAEQEVRRLNDELQRQVDELQTLLELLPIGVWRGTADCRQIFGNRTAYEMLDLPPGINATAAANGPLAGVVALRHGEPIPRDERPFERAARTRQLVRNDEIQLRFADGRLKTLYYNVAPLLEHGEVRGIVGVCTDLTERRRVEDALRESEERFRTFLDNTPACMWLKDEAGQYVLVNKTFLETVRRDEPAILHHTDYDLFPKEVADRLRQNDQMVLETGEATEFQEAPLDGEERHFLSVKFPVTDPHGHRCVGGVALDITAQVHADREIRRLNQQLLERNAELQTLLDLVPMPIFLAPDADCRRVTGNRAAAALIHMPPGSNLSKSAPPEERPVFYKLVVDGQEIPVDDYPLQRAASGQEVRGQEYDIVFEDGSLRHIYGYASPLYDDQGQVRGALAAVLDITPLKEAEQALLESRERFRVAQDLSLDAFTILHAVRDPDGQIVDFEWEYANAAAGRILKHAPGELVGRRLLELLPGNRDHGGLFQRYVDIVNTGQSDEHELFYDSDGIRGWFRNVTVRLGDGIAVSFSDITEQRQREEELRASEARFRQLAEAMPQIVWIANPQGENIYLNEQWTRTTGRTVDDGLRGGWADALHPDDRLPCIRNWQTCIRTGTPYTAEFRLRSHDGQYRWQLARGVPIRNEQGEIISWFGTSTEIDETKRLNEALREADRRKDEFVATLAHELRNPLAPIRNAVELLKQLPAPHPDLAWIRDVIERQVVQMARLLEDLLDVSRITLNRLSLRKQTVTIGEIVENALEISRPVIEAGEHHLQVDLPSDQITLYADPVRLSQVLANLLNNAAKYTDPGGHIRLSAARQGNDLILSVRDNGMGIAPDVLPRVFDMFAQATPALERAQGGLGIGLSLVRGLVEMHGGSVEARSEGLGHGSEFVVRIPLATPASQPPAPVAAALAATPHGCRVVIADDLKDNLTSLAMLLKRLGHEVRTASDGQEAIDAAREFHPDVVLLDIGMPRLNGYEAARRIRAEPWGQHLLLVALTGWGQDEDVRRAMESGFDHHLTKPVNPAALQQLLAAAKG